jgi:hypothetical protein
MADDSAEDRQTGDEAGGVLTLVCLKCGTEYYFSEGAPPRGMTCEKCGNGVFRDFFSPAEGSEASDDFDETTSRDLDPDDAEGDTLPGDVLDLNRD